MLDSWFSSKSNRHRKTPPPALRIDNTHSGPSDTSSVSRSTVGPPRTPGNLTLASDVPLGEVHAHINDPSAYARTSTLIHSTPEKEAGTLKTSDAPGSLDTTAQRVSAPKRPERTLFTPQDAIIAQVFRKTAQPAVDVVHATPSPSSNAPQPSVSLTTSDLLPSQAPHMPGPTLTIYDPFSGAKLGENTPVSPSTATPAAASTSLPLPTADDRKLWSSLERILELQAEIAAMHADMEGVGTRGAGNTTFMGGVVGVGVGEGGNGRSRKRSKRSQTLPVGDEWPEEHETEGGPMGGAVSEISTEHSNGEDDDNDEDDDEDEVRGYGKRRRDEEFAKLAEQFSQRKAAIDGIMNKLDALSTALKTFHTLPPPLFDLATPPSRRESSVPSNLSGASSSPHHVYHGRLSSPFSSIPTSQTSNPVRPPTTSLSPPVPPISTLASSKDPSAAPGLAPVVAPVLPRVALPTIIPEAPRVESPADMHHAQSILRGVP